MAIIKCKMCGGTLQFENGTSVGICEYCGTKQTLPRIDDERKANLYDRANHFRRNNEFDKAMSIYEHILNEDTTDAESYWSILLCRYGIEYVEDTTTHKRIPTVNRAQFTSIFDDEDYKSALQYADGNQRKIYEAEATAINEIQRGILAISQKEEPFDVFVCYKETDNNGRRTRDSVLATELYQELTREGFKVFFSRITLEDKLGTAYEPYIFAALNTAKVMVVLGTRPEHFNAVWVKNEWSRYLALIKNGARKVLIPAYRDMDPYDLPEEFSHLQALDMSKLGFMQDLIRGIKKIVGSDVPKTTVHETIVTSSAVANTAPLLKRAFMFLEDDEFERADEFCEQVLNLDPENARAYLGKLMVDMRVRKPAELSNCADSFAGNRNYQKAIRFADEKLAGALKKCLAAVDERNARKAEEARQESVYLKAMDDYKSYDIERLQNAIKIFTSLNGYKDSEERIQQCQAKIDQIRVKIENDRIADERVRLEQKRQTEIKRVEKAKRAKRNKKIIITMSTVIVITAVSTLCINTIVIPQIKYNAAVELMDNEKYEDAITAFKSLDGYSNSVELLDQCERVILDKKYAEAMALMKSEEYSKALDIFMNIPSYSYKDYKDIADNIKYCKYNKAVKFMSDQKFSEALDVFNTLTGYKDSNDYIKYCKYYLAVSLKNDKKYGEAFDLFKTLSEYEDSNQQAIDCLVRMGKYKEAVEQYSLTEIIIPNGAKSIDKHAFAFCENLQTVSIPDSVTVIEACAFWGCKNLKTVNIPNKVTSIGTSAFADCTNLSDIVIPNSVKSIGIAAFQNCMSLTSITIPGSVTVIEGDAFRGCGNLSTVTISKGLETISINAFEDCKKLSKIEIPDSVTTIQGGAFTNCVNLIYIVIPNSVTTVGYNAFEGCSALTVYCRAKTIPSKWNSYWNHYGCPVVWGYSN